MWSEKKVCFCSFIDLKVTSFYKLFLLKWRQIIIIAPWCLASVYVISPALSLLAEGTCEVVLITTMFVHVFLFLITLLFVRYLMI